MLGGSSRVGMRMLSLFHQHTSLWRNLINILGKIRLKEISDVHLHGKHSFHFLEGTHQLPYVTEVVICFCSIIVVMPYMLFAHHLHDPLYFWVF